MESIGNRLKKAREEKGLTLEKVNKHTKIHSRILGALENDSIDEMMNPVYGRNFLKTYAKYLGLNAKEIVDEYTSMHTIMPEPVINLEKRARANQGQREPRESVKASSPIGLLDGIKILYPVLIGIGAIIAIAALVFVGSAGIKIAKNYIAQKRTEQPKNIASKKRNKFFAKAEEKSLAIPKNQSLILKITAKDNVWMQLKADGKVIFAGILSKDTSEVWRAADRFDIWTGKAEFMDMTLNGNPLGSPGKGVIKDIAVTRKGLQAGGE